MPARSIDRLNRSVAALLVVGVGFFCTLAPKAPVGSNDVPTGAGANLAPGLVARAAVEPLALEAALTQASAVITTAASLGSTADGWSAITRFRTTDGWFATPVHATSMADGRILFTGIARQADPPVAGTVQRRISWIMPIPGLGPMPAEMTVHEVTEPVEFAD